METLHFPQAFETLLQFVPQNPRQSGKGTTCRVTESGRLCSSPIYETVAVSQTLTGKVVEVDQEGNLVTDIAVASLQGAPRDANLRIVVDEHETYGLYPTDHSQPAMTLIAIADEAGPLRIALVGDSASAMLGVRVGAMVEVHW